MAGIPHGEPTPDETSVSDLARAATREHAPAGRSAIDPDARPGGTWWLAARWALLGGAMAILAGRIGAVADALTPPPPLRAGSQASDPDLDSCIDRLWRLAAVLEQESLATVAASPLTEPVTGRPYVVTNERGDPIIACPTPERHGAKAVRSQASHPQPEVLR